ncbi:hypothetical protein FRB96_007096 [Tulasnella sp. 330]|nr:hypothetical protein FRB96_007096 [Tulasnella sp. 330]KAG8880048.1 hypothetical protein FRB97_001199 [Tulasnella sp. 331]KAG8887184.1 hypothetical protein FRB98_000394 [Tulasnella sp. 332]
MAFIARPNAPTNPQKPEAASTDKIDFWHRYDNFAETHDKAMLDRLDRDLDVLLIFAGLFSAINTAFIVLTITDLSAPPQYQTNALLILQLKGVAYNTLSSNDLNPPFTPPYAAVRQNSAFLASLCASVLASAGAMVGKQWLQSYDRAGQTGSHELQAMRRTEKWLGAETWYLRPVVESLPMLLLISLGLFFIALGDYLLSTNRSVANVVIGFAVVGGTLYSGSVIVAAIYPNCPFQTSVSRLLQRIYDMGRTNTWLRFLYLRTLDFLIEMSVELSDATVDLRCRWRRRYETLVEKMREQWEKPPVVVSREIAANTWERFWKSTVVWMVGIRRPWTKPSTFEVLTRAHSVRQRREQKILQNEARRQKAAIEKSNKTETIHAQAILWMWQNATEEDDLYLIAENIPQLTRLQSAKLLAFSNLLPRLVRRFRNTLDEVSANISPAGTAEGGQHYDATSRALVYGRAVAQVVLADPSRCFKALGGDFPEVLGDDHSQIIPPDPILFDLRALALSLNALVEGFTHPIGPRYTNLLRKSYYEILNRVHREAILEVTSLLKVSYASIPDEIISADGTSVSRDERFDDALVSLICLEIVELADGERPSSRQRVKDIWAARDKSNVLVCMTRALAAHDRLMTTNHDRQALLKLHTQLLSSFRYFHWSAPAHKQLTGVHDFVSIAIQHLGTLLRFLSTRGTTTYPIIQDHVTQLPTSTHSEPPETGLSVLDAAAGRKVVFLKYDTHEPRTFVHTRLLPWKGKLRQNPAVAVENLRGEIHTYATELLLSLGLQDMLDGRHHDFTEAGATAVLDITLKVLEVESSVTTATDMISLLRVLSSTISNLDADGQEPWPDSRVRFPRRDLLTSYLHDFTPFIHRALESDSSQVLAAACRLLDAIGHSTWSKTFTPHGGNPTVIDTELGCLVIKRLREEVEKGPATFIELVESGYREGEVGDDQNGLLRLLGASVYKSPPLAFGLVQESNLQALFVKVVPEIAERIESKEGFGQLDLALAWNLTFLFLGAWSATRQGVGLSGSAIAHNTIYGVPESGAEVPPATPTTAYGPLAMYALSGMQALQADQMNVHMFSLTFAYIEVAFLQHPDPARSASLDTACEALIVKATAWERELSKSTVRQKSVDLTYLVSRGEKARCAWLPAGHPLRSTTTFVPEETMGALSEAQGGSAHAELIYDATRLGSPRWNTDEHDDEYRVAGPSWTNEPRNRDRSMQPRPSNPTRRSAMKRPSYTPLPQDRGPQTIDTTTRALGDSTTSSDATTQLERLSPVYLQQMLGKVTNRAGRGGHSDDVEASPTSFTPPDRSKEVRLYDRPAPPFSPPAFPMPAHIPTNPKYEEHFHNRSADDAHRNRTTSPTANKTRSGPSGSAIWDNKALPKVPVPDQTPSPGMPEPSPVSASEPAAQNSNDLGWWMPPDGSTDDRTPIL